VLRAVERIAGGELITTIAHDLGYGSSATFTSMFRRVLGVPPRRYATLASENDGRGA
jgi:AraC-like DNA-binding protein